MSTTKRQPTTVAEYKDQLRQATEPYEKSAQAHDDPHGKRHNDGEAIHRRWNNPPFWKRVERLERKDHQITRFPKALLDCLLHVTDDDLERIRAGDDFQDVPEHRRKMLQWFQEDIKAGQFKGDSRHLYLDEGGTDAQIYGPPRKGKTTVAGNFADWLMQLNNETIIWSETIGDDGVIERTQWLPFAPYTTLMVPKGLEVVAEVVPDNAAVPRFEVPLEQIARDVKRYQGPRDVNRMLQAGQFHVVIPDPRFQGCEKVTRFNYVSPWDADGVDDATNYSHWWFAGIANRISERRHNHWTSYFIDEAGNWLEEEAGKDDHDTRQKIKFLRDKYGDAAKHKVSIFNMTHAMEEMNHFIRRKIRWWVTMAGAEVPVGQTLPGNKTPPQTYSKVPKGKGRGQIWTPDGQYANLKSTNLQGFVPLDADIVLKFPEVMNLA